MRRERISGLDVVLAGGSDREGGGDGPLVVILHGFGAPGDDLVSLWRVLYGYDGIPPSTRFAFPAAPLEVDPNWGGRAWWMIDVMALQMAMLQGRTRDLASNVPDGLPEARAQIISVVDELRTRLSPTKLILGGFSQGAMLSLDVALRKEVDAVVLLSTTLIAESEWLPLMQTKKSLPVFQSHGQQDPMLPFSAAEKLREHLTNAGLSVDWVPFRGQHEIPSQVLDRLAAFLTRQLVSK
jgi:phospholipase/carboxylesterase